MSERMEEQLEKELDKFAGKDLTNQSLETVYKLAKSYYYLVAARKMNEDSGYSEAVKEILCCQLPIPSACSG